jgi:hypothetical protein
VLCFNIWGNRVDLIYMAKDMKAFI